MNKTKKKIIALTLSAAIMGGGFTALNTDAFASSKNDSEITVEAIQLANQVKSVATLSEFSKIQFEDFTFGKFHGGLAIDYPENGTVILTDSLGESVEVNEDLFYKYVEEPDLDPLFEYENLTGSEKERQELKEKENQIIREDPWAMMYNDVERKQINTEGKTFGQVYEETGISKFDANILEDKSLQGSKDFLADEYGIVELTEKTMEQLNEAEKFVRVSHFYGVETEGKTLEQIKEEVLNNNATLRLIEVSKDMPYDPNWLIEKENWWFELYGTTGVNQ
ncbi:hypothetical protein [Bacillus solimangrovi]|uniref:Peptidase n=1 Tax=Bacillus solimangrovi TaxID=1305675 RepID=A0A1E5LB82_9BACI|nr:hypothetical protein [Bacillus solimangrovi]OEH91354.1 hypothetical protein BFG57_05670 [Bacillus solimangrovi]